jgi:hypothetical protein
MGEISMVRRSALSLALVACLAALGLQSPSRAASEKDSDLPPVDSPEHWHVMTSERATTESKCVGNPRTALCAVETMLACEIHNDDDRDLCLVAANGESAYLWYYKEDFKAPHMIATKYRVIEVRRLTSRRWPVGVQSGEPAPNPGDVQLRLHLLEYREGEPRPHDLAFFRYVDYFLRKTGDRWLVIGYRNGPRL